jgi:predicted adenylyl cyclase CyaB
MPRNLEIKVAVASLAPYRRRLAALDGCRRAGVLRQADHYFGGVSGYLKLRVIDGVAGELIAYRRPRRAAARESRYVKWEVDDPRGARRVLAAALGVEAVVRKTREVWLTDGARIHLDRVAGLGAFVEIEVLVERAGRRPAARMRELRERLRLPARAVPGSYRDLLRPPR